MANQIVKSVNVKEIFENTASQTDPNPLYANQAKISTTDTELFIDFILLSPPVVGEEATATHIKRLIYPLAGAKNLVRAINTIIDRLEQDEETPTNES